MLYDKTGHTKSLTDYSIMGGYCID